MTTKTKGKRSTAADSEAVRAAAEKKRINKPVTLKGVSLGALVTISPADYKHLDIDPEYQRGQIQGEISSLVAAINAGGFVPDPVTLVKRSWAVGADAKKLWIIDGQQRVAAFSQLDKSFQAMVYHVETYDAEKNFFLVMNTRQAVNASVFVHSWPGPGAEMIRQAHNQVGHPLHGRVLWTVGSSTKIAAAVLAKGMVAAAIGGATGNSIQLLLSRLDHALRNEPGAKDRVRTFIELAAHVFPTGYAPSLAVQALGQVAYKRWMRTGFPNLPTPRRMTNISLLKWDKLVPTNATRWRGFLELEIEKRWGGAVDVVTTPPA